ncbi:MAG: hypothetical protein ACRDTJ_33185 [Pseudonocardiaceae bacterium]
MNLIGIVPAAVVLLRTRTYRRRGLGRPLARGSASLWNPLRYGAPTLDR